MDDDEVRLPDCQSRLEACHGRIAQLEAALRGMLQPRNASWRAIARDLLAVPEEEWITHDGDWSMAQIERRRAANTETRGEE